MSHHRSPLRRYFFNRRRAIVQLLIAALIILSMAVPASTKQASASVGWCRSDPVIVVNLTLADVFTSAQISDLTKVTGATQIIVVTPTGVFANLATFGVGFGYGEFVTFEQSPSLKVTPTEIQVIIKVFVPAIDSSMPIQVDFAPRVVGLLSPVSGEGYANSWLVLRTAM